MTTNTLKRLNRLFKVAYDFLYEIDDVENEYENLVDEFDRDFVLISDEFKAEIMRGFLKIHKDYVSSDRECKAFMIAYKQLLKELKEN